MTEKLRVGSLFSGYSGLDMAVCRYYDAEVVWHVEFDKHPSAILAHHYPDIPNYGDIIAVDWSGWSPWTSSQVVSLSGCELCRASERNAPRYPQRFVVRDGEGNRRVTTAESGD